MFEEEEEEYKKVSVKGGEPAIQGKVLKDCLRPIFLLCVIISGMQIQGQASIGDDNASQLIKA